MKSKRIITKYVLIAMIVFTLAFIFVNSMLPTEVSKAESDNVTGWLEQVLPEESVISLFMLNNTRKIAHFVEFGVLSAELTVYALLFAEKKRNGVTLAFLMSFIAAFLDETIQIFSLRGAAVSDVWIDLFGALSFSAVTLLAYFICIAIQKYKRSEAENGEN